MPRTTGITSTPRQHQLLRLNAFMLAAGPHQSLRQPPSRILGANGRDLLLLALFFPFVLFCFFFIYPYTAVHVGEALTDVVGSRSSGTRGGGEAGGGYGDAVV